MRESIFEVRGPDGQVRRGILTQPTSPAITVVVLLPAGLKYHVGPHRLNVKLARQLAAIGYTVLRVDPLGLGESDGVLGPAPTRALWRMVEVGGFVDDVLLVCRALRDQFDGVPLVVGGLCGGAITAQLAAAEPCTIRGVISIATPVTQSRADGEPPSTVSEALARHHMRSYLFKFGSKAAWLRVVRGESDFHAIRRTVQASLRSWFGGRSNAIRYPSGNPKFLESFHALQKSGVEHLLLFGENDNRWIEFQAAVLQPYLQGARMGKHYAIETIPDANHELHFSEWQHRAAQIIVEWLERHFPCGAREGVSVDNKERGVA